MPKVTLPALPLSALFAIAKPSGPGSMTVVELIKPLLSSSKLFATDDEGAATSKIKKGKGKNWRGGRAKSGVKIGTGGTLDPLADGVLVLGVNEGTKKLGGFLECTKEYRTTCLLGAETDSYDSDGAVSRVAPFSHVTRSSVEDALAKFRGEILQVPPLFSALKMNGMPLYEYARKGIPLPRPIEARKTTVHSLTLEKWIEASDHSFTNPEKRLTKEEREKARTAFVGAQIALPADAAAGEAKSEDVEPVSEPKAKEEVDEDDFLKQRAPAFVLRMEVSGGTYIRSIVHDVCRSIGSAGHVVTLTRTKQGAYVLGEPSAPSESTAGPSSAPATTSAAAEPQSQEDTFSAVPWDVVESAAKKLKAGTLDEEARDADGWLAWERAVLSGLGVAETRKRT
ncbi:pseudouridylate synthase 4 [Auriculariales sp. MPI-PUGE-AT-0066]|nr:pseudouridylate synthase 4 [Auriculariales sp. MPI-PUGE-AT-0066]